VLLRQIDISNTNGGKRKWPVIDGGKLCFAVSIVIYGFKNIEAKAWRMDRQY